MPPPPPILFRGMLPSNRPRSSVDLPSIQGGSARGNPEPRGDATPAPLEGAADSRPSYPAALPSVLSSKFNGPVTGVAIIDHEYGAIDMLVEMVTPDATPLLEPLTQEYLHDCREEMDLKCRLALARGDLDTHDDEESSSLAGSEEACGGPQRPAAAQADPVVDLSTAAERHRHERERRKSQLFESEGRGFVSNAPQALASGHKGCAKKRLSSLFRSGSKEALSGAESTGAGGSSAALDGMAGGGKARRERRNVRVLKEGGYVIFADEYLQNHPCSPVASITQEYQLVNPQANPPPSLNPKLDEKKRKLEGIRRLIREAENQNRPLFRRRPTELVYGEASYIRRPSNDDPLERNLPQNEEDVDVYYASSFDSTCLAQPGHAGRSPSSHSAKQREVLPAALIQPGANGSGTAKRHRIRSSSSSVAVDDAEQQ